MTWLKLDIGVVQNDVWRDWLVSRLWFWILCKAKASSTPGVLRFSYPVVAEQLAGRDGNRMRKPSRDSLRRALRTLVRQSRLSVREWQQGPQEAAVQGGRQGYLTVEVNNWGFYQHGHMREQQGPPQDPHRGLDPESLKTATPRRERKKRERRREHPTPPAAAVELARHLLEAIQSHDPGFRRTDRVLAGWAVSIDRAMRIDGRSADDVRRAIDFAHRSDDSFWRPNIQSGAKLREKMDQLLAQARRHEGAPEVPPSDYQPMSPDDATRNGFEIVRDE